MSEEDYTKLRFNNTILRLEQRYRVSYPEGRTSFNNTILRLEPKMKTVNNMLAEFQ